MAVVLILQRTNVLHVVAAAALGATLERTLAAQAQPLRGVRVGGAAGAADELLVAGALDADRVVQCAEAVRRQRAHVEDVDTLHLAQNFETLETGRLFEVRRDCAGVGTFGQQVLFGADVYLRCRLSVVLVSAFLGALPGRRRVLKMLSDVPSSVLSMLRPVCAPAGS